MLSRALVHEARGVGEWSRVGYIMRGRSCQPPRDGSRQQHPRTARERHHSIMRCRYDGAPLNEPHRQKGRWRPVQRKRPPRREFVGQSWAIFSRAVAPVAFLSLVCQPSRPPLPSLPFCLPRLPHLQCSSPRRSAWLSIPTSSRVRRDLNFSDPRISSYFSLNFLLDAIANIVRCRGRPRR